MPAPGARLKITIGSIALLTAMSALGQFATTVYLPSMPAMTAALDVSSAAMQQTLTAFLLVFGLGQLFVGPLSDRVGRRKVLFAGLAVFLAGTGLCAMAPEITTLIAGRALQALGACATVVTARAAIRDSFEGAEMARVMGFISIVFGIVPGFAPLIGGVLQELLGWTAAFWAMAAFAGGVWFAAWRWLPETGSGARQSLGLVSVFGGYGAMLGSWRFMGNALLSASIFGALFSFLAGSPGLYIEHLGVSPAEYGIYPPMTVLGSMLGGALTGRLAGRWSAAGLTMFGLAFAVCGAGLMLALSLFGGMTPATVTATVFVFVVSLGICMPTTMSAAMADFGDRAGAAAALLGFFQMSGSAAGPICVGLLATLGRHAFPVSMAGFALLSLLIGVGLLFSRESAPRTALSSHG